METFFRSTGKDFQFGLEYELNKANPEGNFSIFNYS